MRWSSFLIRGVAAILFGIIALVAPGIALGALILVFGAYAFVDGIFAVVAGLRAPGSTNWYLVVVGAIGVIAGIIAFVSPGLTALALLTLIGVWAVIAGIAELVAAWHMRKAIENEFWLALSGLIAVIFGIYVLLAPGAGALALIVVIGVFAIAEGIFFLVLAWRLRKLEETAIPVR